MTLRPTTAERIARARNDLRIGVPVCIAGSVVVAVESLSQSRFDALMALGRDRARLVLTERRAATLRARAYDGDVARIVLPEGATLAWLRASADPSTDLANPMKGPYHSDREGSADVHRAAIALCKQAFLLPAALVIEGAGDDAFAAANGFTTAPLLDPDPEVVVLDEASAARVPLEVSAAGRVHVFRPRDGAEEHYAIEIGQPDRTQPVLSRLHSACFTGDVIGSLKCDCGPQLRAALAQMGQEGHGVLLYLNQEGRGIGLANKMRAYALQDQGFDTVEANHRLGFEDDERDFRIGAQILKSLGFSAVRLMTNNPGKVRMMEGEGVQVAERVPLRVGETEQNAAYLATKAAKSGHFL
ncbi:GTP cyclohydrolase II [Monaibacterium marinum]|uniref:GTP cyclohydrolase-2 n=1 Tax=Pontivivens marinum TaxID=1690039 RepID=A0A2C9CNW9_9RHOB|nr:GTP cyclohydrolase II [Monaibacterium marinum]SOH92943.1 GTP cyclohydrolase II [Monaibacterium marinum]